MYAGTHYKIGFFYYCMFTCIVSSLGFSAIGFDKITLAGIIFSAIGGVFPDIDYEYSPVRTNNLIYRLLKRYNIITLMSFIYFLYLVVIVFYMPISFFSYENLLDELKAADRWELTFFVASYLTHVVIFLLSIKFRKHLKTRVIPILAVLIIYNHVLPPGVSDWGAFMVLLFIFTASIFPHRTFTHSIEGFICYSLAAIYLAAKSNFIYIGFCFSLGYFTHLWLADIFTHYGVHTLYLVYFLGEKGIISKETPLYAILGKKRSFHLMTVGSDRGHFIESAYVIGALIVLSIIMFATVPKFAII